MIKRSDAEKELLKMAGISGDRIILLSKFTPVPYAEKLMEKNTFLFDNFKRFWRYDLIDGIWKEDAEMFIRHELRLNLVGEEQQKKQYMDEVVSYIKDICWTENNVSQPPEEIIAFKNCLFDINTEEFLEFDKKYFITNKIPVILDSQFVDCDIIDSFFAECVGEKKKIILYELLAYCMLRQYPNQKFFILHGKGANGKSVYLNIIRKFLGINNVSNETPQSLVTNRFSRGNLWNKLANIGSDIPYISLDNTNVIKELTGEDYLNCERKFREPFPFKNYAKLIWSANELPQVNDKTYAFYRRVYIINFIKTVSEEEQDTQMLCKLTNTYQLSGLAWKLIKILKEMKKKDYDFTWNPTIQEMENLYEDLSNPLSKFLREKTINNKDYQIDKWEFKDKFMQWLRANGFRIWGEREVNSAMSEKYNEGKRSLVVDVFEYGKIKQETKWHRTWEGIGWNK